MHSGFKPFYWIGAALNSKWTEKVAINLPVNIKGETCFFQLDTGSPQSFIYSNAINGSKNKPGEKITVNGEINDKSFQHTFVCAPFEKNNAPLADTRLSASGIIGMDFLEDKALWLDFQKQAFFFDQNFRKNSINELNFDLVDISVSTHIFFNLNLPTGERIKAMFNSGPSFFPFITDKDTWLSLTTSNSKAPEVHEIVSGFQRKIRLTGNICTVHTHPVSLSLLDRPVYYPEKGADIFCFKNLDYSAIIGHHFFQQSSLYLNVPEQKAGFFNTSLNNAEKKQNFYEAL